MKSDIKKLSNAMSYIWLLGIIFATSTVASYNPPAWADGWLYYAWCLLVFFAIVFASTTPVGIVVLLSFKIFGSGFATFLTMVFIWYFDHYMHMNYPMVMITPLCAFSALYVFVLFMEQGRIKLKE